MEKSDIENDDDYDIEENDDMDDNNTKKCDENELDDNGNECEIVHDLAEENVPVLNAILW